LTDRSGAVWVGCCETLFVVKTQILAENISHAVTEVAIASYAIFAAIYVAYQIRKWRAGKPTNLPKLLLLAAMVPLRWLEFGYAARFGADGILQAGMALGLCHSCSITA